MNKTKKILLILASLFLLLQIALSIYLFVISIINFNPTVSSMFFVIFNFIDILFLIAVFVMLVYVLWGNGKYFRERYRYFITALIISICINLFSVPTILMIISIYFNDSVIFYQNKQKSKEKNIVDIFPNEKEEENIDKKEADLNDKEQKIKKLREMKEAGKLTEEQFQEELMKLL